MSVITLFSSTCVILSSSNCAAIDHKIRETVANFQAPQTVTRSLPVEHRCDDSSIAPTRKTCVAALDDFLASGAGGALFCVVLQGRGPIAAPNFSHSVLLDVDRGGAGSMIQRLPEFCRGIDPHMYKQPLDHIQMRDMMQNIDDVVDDIDVALNLSRITGVEHPLPVDDCIGVLILTLQCANVCRSKV